MKFNPVFLYKENDLNKVIRRHKNDNSAMALLYVSLWDKRSIELVEKINQLDWDARKTPLYIMDSFNMPHSFVIFGTDTTPTLVLNRRGKVLSERWLSNIYTTIDL